MGHLKEESEKGTGTMKVMTSKIIINLLKKDF